ncbi:MAG: GNAT family N-acetyltransferase [Bacteroidota bacterium]
MNRLSDIHIRTNYRGGDIGYITYMHGDFYDFGREFEIYVAETLADFYQNLDERKERFWVAEDQGKIIGTIALKDTDGLAQLRYFLIDPAYRGLGLGNQLLQLFLDFMKECGYKRSFLVTEKQLETAKYLYGKLGYEYVSSSETDFGLVEMRYEMTL